MFEPAGRLFALAISMGQTPYFLASPWSVSPLFVVIVLEAMAGMAAP
jgi:hypothetical protein